MKNLKRKGFTIVELVIVIAVIVILAAVLIPTFSSLVKKANQSADIQAVRQLNEAITLVSVEEKYETIDDLTIALLSEKINISDYRPMTKDYSFYWIKSENKIVLADENNKIIYPENLSTTVFNEDEWKNLKSSVLYSAMGQGGKLENGKIDLGSGDISYYISEDSELNLDDNVVTYNLTDKQLELYGGNTIDSTAFCVNGSSANLVLNGGTIQTNSNGVAVRQGGTATINGTTIKANTHCVYAQEGTIVIEDGFFEGTGDGQYNYVLNCKDAAYASGTANIIVKGGTYVNFNPANNKAEGEGTNFVAAGYKVVEEAHGTDTWYIVVPE